MTRKMPLAEVNGISINYSLEGEGGGELIVLVSIASRRAGEYGVSNQRTSANIPPQVNGLADDLQTWDYQMPAFLAAGYRVLRYDNRGIGKSSCPSGPYTAEMMADDLHGLLELPELAITRFHLLGVSMGGMTAQAYALKHPNGSGGLEMLSLSLCCTYAEPTGFCLRMFK